MPGGDRSWHSRSTLSHGCSTCTFEDGSGDLIFCCQCGSGIQLLYVNPSCYNCGHHFLWDGPIIPNHRNSKATLRTEETEAPSLTFNELLFRRAADPAQRWSKPISTDNDAASCGSSPRHDPLELSAAERRALPAPETPHDTLEQLLGPLPSSPELAARVYIHARERCQETSPQGLRLFEEHVFKRLHETDWPDHPLVWDIESSDQSSDETPTARKTSSIPRVHRDPTLSESSHGSHHIAKAAAADSEGVNEKTRLLPRAASRDSSVEVYSSSETSPSTCSSPTATPNSNTEYDDSTETETSPSTVTLSYPRPSIISYLARNIVNRVMNGIHFFFDVKSGIIQCTTGSNHNTPTAKSQNASGHSNPNNRQAEDGNKRREGGRDSHDPPQDQSEDDHDDDSSNKRQKLNNGRRAQKSTKRFACPYFQRDPEKHKDRRSCAGPGWFDIHHVKDHLYHYHEVRPCPRCRLDLKTDKALKLHLQAPQICENQAPRPCDGIDEVKKAKLQNRKGWSRKTPIRKWEAIYQILFPNDNILDMPSPFYENGDSSSSTGDPVARFERYCRRELPRSVRTRLEKVVEEHLLRDGDLITNQIESIIRESWDGVVSSFQEVSGIRGISIVPNSTPAKGYEMDVADEDASTMPASNGTIQASLDGSAFPVITLEAFDATRFRPCTPPLSFNNKVAQGGSDEVSYSANPAFNIDEFFENLNDPSSTSCELTTLPFSTSWDDDYMGSGASTSTPHLIEQNMEQNISSPGTTIVKVIPEIRLPTILEREEAYMDITNMLHLPNVWYSSE
ncbi:uncharacterized protein BDZ99DRAFT_522988 [Mytilinidion resinicola]|uniref:C2H2-type domain-containing protein n=1 Tax=Mytilinidion resinicola TaxID=574789 RepID=A0A6A6YFJ4_9PEZI|nr:uncharacterized protein BDZ99DRAFT_522988 [Mytilinidion resinicola]KAF2807369.1 hypothetical protein BDZ99DRAFT_522988 [Mytilinidion resinicola]